MQEQDETSQALVKINEAGTRQASKLDLSRLNLTAVPEQIRELSQLQILSLDHNQLTSIPESLGQLSQLQILSLEGNQLAEDWQAAIARGTGAVLERLRSLAREGETVSPRTVKLVLLGEP
ncbi:MAG: leucine-rich repeat domain-containing protein, partial [Acidobacteriaceae bacterium]|nr:leucine-rich repeat domain-containing protein [Acidobacteriaceae bacterium]